MPGFDAIIGQSKPVALLRTLLAKGSLPHALLFTGVEGIGKARTALILAKACNCLGPTTARPASNFSPSLKAGQGPTPIEPCNECQSCRKISSGNHPDIITVEPSGGLIRIAQIREICAAVALKPHEARQRVVIIDDAHLMNPEASNALLKVLEEPPGENLLVLIAPRPTDVLPTVASRCQHVRFHPLAHAQIAAWLVRKYQAASQEAHLIAALANGSLTRAAALVQGPWQRFRSWLLQELATLPAKPAGEVLALAELLAQDNTYASDGLDIMASWLRDLLVFQVDPQRVLNQDYLPQIRASARNTEVQTTLSKLKAVLAAQRHLRGKGGFNQRLMLEVLTLQLAEQTLIKADTI